MKPTKTKAEIRAELDAQVNAFLTEGGNIESVPRGISGNANNNNLFAQSGENAPRQDRTPLGHVVKEMEARKQSHGSTGPTSKGRPKKIVIRDDFGEPVRWIWSDDPEAEKLGLLEKKPTAD